jgi:hypothetical protein
MGSDQPDIKQSDRRIDPDHSAALALTFPNMDWLFTVLIE